MLKARVVTALCLIAGLLAVLFYFNTLVATVVFAGIAGLAAWEWGGLMQTARRARAAFVAGVLVACFFFWQQPQTIIGLLWATASLFWLLLAPLYLLRGWRLSSTPWLGHVLGGGLIVATWAAMVGLHARAPLLLLAAMATVWVADSAAYFAGRAFGRRKLAPAISPGKTWEGVAGALLGVIGYGVLLHTQFLDVALPPLLLGLMVMLVLSIIGDLFESLAKRQVGLKDSGNLLPGHGGVLDRIDSLLPTLPVAALLMEYLRT